MHEQYEDTMGKWVTARCSLRRDVYGKPMPAYVKTWLDGIGHGSNVDGLANATDDVLNWLTQTIENPDWPSPVPTGPKPGP
ncbi:MAG: hypothetical protein IH983_10145 [Planctomycetes bacterium]|nr:hypothetical protein [Planctomycetota bacterium]